MEKRSLHLLMGIFLLLFSSLSDHCPRAKTPPFKNFDHPRLIETGELAGSRRSSFRSHRRHAKFAPRLPQRPYSECRLPPFRKPPGSPKWDSCPGTRPDLPGKIDRRLFKCLQSICGSSSILKNRIPMPHSSHGSLDYLGPQKSGNPERRLGEMGLGKASNHPRLSLLSSQEILRKSQARNSGRKEMGSGSTLSKRGGNRGCPASQTV